MRSHTRGEEIPLYQARMPSWRAMVVNAWKVLRYLSVTLGFWKRTLTLCGVVCEFEAGKKLEDIDTHPYQKESRQLEPHILNQEIRCMEQ